MKQRQSTELTAVLHIFNADDELRMKALPHVNTQTETIYWDDIWASGFGGGHSAAVTWAKAIWCDQVTTKGDPFDRAFAMSPKLKKAVLTALAIRWSI